MNSIKDLLPGSMRERTFQLKARRDAGAVWNDPQFVECKKCGRRATRQIWNKAQYVCPNCGVHLPIGGYYRLSLVLDKGSFRELDADLAPQDVLQFPGYPEKLEAQTGKTGLKEAVITATGRIEGTPVVAAVLDSRFFMGSMSTTVGEKITRAVEHATAKHLPLIIFSASGVTASFASLGDIMLAEPGALIGFAGPRVIEQTIGEKLPAGFQRSEFQYEHGFVDKVVPRTEMRETLAQLLRLHA